MTTKTHDAIIVGDGPGGLSAALFLAKNGLDVVVLGQDKTAMHWALLKNYLGIPEIHGSEFQKTARQQVVDLGATLREERVETVAEDDAGFTVTTEGGETLTGRHLILSEGKGPRLAKLLGLEPDAGGAIPVDRNGLSAIPRVYVVGRSVRPGRSQAIISAGDGAAAAIDILSRNEGEPFADWDSPPES
ncbi:MAG: thioredoxin reductase [Sandaracinus sp.]|nr:thioredoxin reductase [Sandaracinus sp.]